MRHAQRFAQGVMTAAWQMTLFTPLGQLAIVHVHATR
jgi:hypothetical protein